MLDGILLDSVSLGCIRPSIICSVVPTLTSIHPGHGPTRSSTSAQAAAVGLVQIVPWVVGWSMLQDQLAMALASPGDCTSQQGSERASRCRSETQDSTIPVVVLALLISTHQLQAAFGQPPEHGMSEERR